MDQDYHNVLKHFSLPETRYQSEEYLRKYWLSEAEWYRHWETIQDCIFCPESRHLPEMMFKDDFELLPLIGGLIFAQEDFQALQECMQVTADKLFVVIENKHTQPKITGEKGERIFHPPLRFKFPTDITWKELLSGGLLSMEVFEMSYKEFFVFGDSGKWGKYVANEYWDLTLDSAGTPLDIIGFKDEFSDVFREKFKVTDEEKQQIVEWLPDVYKERIDL